MPNKLMVALAGSLGRAGLLVFALLAITSVLADPAEGEAMTEAGNDLVETVPMPESVQAAIRQFVAEHHVERQFTKRKRDRANTEALAKPNERGRG